MTSALIQRNITPLAEEALNETPITVISGARQVGKSTLMRQLLNTRNARIVNLDSAIERSAAERDPDGFAQQFPDGILAIDEIQRVPQLVLALKNTLELDRKPGRFLLTGSADLLSLRGVGESLAGRAQTIALHGLSRGEILGRIEDFSHFLWNLPDTHQLIDAPEYSRRDYLELITTSSYPEIYKVTPRSRNRWLANYLDRILSKDAPDITGVHHPDRLRPLLQVLAAENASEFVSAHPAQQLDIPIRSVPTYLKALRDLFLIRALPAWSNNLTTRTVSKPKIILSDTGIATFLCGVDVAGLERHISSSVTGNLVEGFVAAELAKQQSWSNIDYTLNHFRDRRGREVDLVLENRKREIVGIEVKATVSVTNTHFRGLEYLREKAGNRFRAGVVLHTGPQAVPFGDRLWALPLAAIWKA